VAYITAKTAQDGGGRPAGAVDAVQAILHLVFKKHRRPLVPFQTCDTGSLFSVTGLLCFMMYQRETVEHPSYKGQNKGGQWRCFNKAQNWQPLQCHWPPLFYVFSEKELSSILLINKRKTGNSFSVTGLLCFMIF